MNSLTLIGEVVGEPVYHCGTRAQDIVRIRLRTLDRNGGKHVHHCVGFGPAAIDLHTHLKPGEQLLVRGELLYRKRMVDGDIVSLPYILLRGYSYLGTFGPVAVTPFPVRGRAPASGVS